MAGNVNTAPTRIKRLTTRFNALFVGARDNSESGASARSIVRATIKAAAGQSVDIVDVTDSSDNVLWAIDSAGVPKGTLIKDTNGLARVVLNPTTKTITDASATSLFDVACLQSGMSGGMIFFTIEASDGADFQAFTGMVSYAVVNKAGTLTLTITNAGANDAKALSGGTLTLAWTFVTGTLKGTVKVQPTGSLTETIYRITYTVFPLIGAVTIL